MKVEISGCKPIPDLHADGRLLFWKSARNTILAGFVDLLVYRTMSHWILFHNYNFPSSSGWKDQTGWGMQGCLVLVNYWSVDDSWLLRNVIKSRTCPSVIAYNCA